jgi:hypothetical protein
MLVFVAARRRSAFCSQRYAGNKLILNLNRNHNLFHAVCNENGLKFSLDSWLPVTGMLTSELKLPNADMAVVEREKIVEYPLNAAHRYGARLDYRLSFGGLMKIKEHDCVVLTADLPGEELKAGDVGTVVHIHKGGAAYEVEFTTLDGYTLTVATVERKQLRPVSGRDVAHVRALQAV